MEKEWKGNSRAGTRILGIKKDHTTSGRETDDFYATDPKALEILLDKCSLYLHDKFNKEHLYFRDSKSKIHEYVSGIWECAVGNGNLLYVLHKRFPRKNVYGSDIKNRGDWSDFKPVNFLETSQAYCIERSIGIILTNPPYSLATEFIEHALDVLPEGGVYIALMNITYLASKKRYERVYQFGSLREVYIFSSRVNCYRNNDKEKYGAQAMVDFAWFVFEKGYCGQPTLYWL